ncbi:MAG: hypothetical protein ACREXP_29460 [Steroidobacteraceae bacterium]
MRSSQLKLALRCAAALALVPFAASVALYNVFDSDDDDITYFDESQLATEPAPVEGIHFHPVEPRTLRVTLAASFQVAVYCVRV